MRVKVYELKNEGGQVFAFEISKPVGGRRRVCSIVRGIPGAKLTKTPRFLSWFREEKFCEFDIGDVKFEAFEPFGDNSRFWIGPKDAPTWHPEIEEVLQAFSGKRERP